MAADNLDQFLPNILTQETRKRIQLHEEIVNYLQNPGASIKCEDMDRFLDGIANWIVASNFKISLNGLEVVSYLIDRMCQGFQVYIPNFLPLIVDRLADNKEQVRNSAQDLLVKLMTTVTTPQYVFERLTFAFSHKSPKVKEEMLSMVQRILQESGTAKNVGVSKIVPHVVKLLEDPNIPIREMAMDTLSVMYQYVGDRLRRDVMKKDVNVSKMGALLARFDEVKNSGLLKLDEASSRSSSSLATRRSEDELDRTSNSSAGDPGSPRTPVTANNNTMPSLSSNTLVKRVQSTPTSTAPRKLSLGNISSPIGIDEESFTKAFNQVSKVSIYSAKDFSERLAKVKDILADQNLEWNKKVDALKEVRAWLTCSSYDVKGHPEFSQMLVTLEPLLHATVRDLRSQVVRETCITVAFLSQELGKDFGHFAETILPPLVSLIPNSAKVMATSAVITIKFILQNSHNHKLIPIVASNLSSKSNIIRRQCCEFMSFILQNWPTSVMEKQLPVIQDMIKKGIVDADSEARLNSRKAFWNFSENFKSQADQLLQSLEPSKQRQLMGEQQGSSSSSLVDLGESGRASSTNGIAVVTTPSSSLAGQGRTGRRYSGASTNHDRIVPSSGYGIRRISKDRPDGGHATSDLDLTSLSDKMSKVGIGSNSQSNRSHQALYGTLRKSKAYSSMSSSKQSQASSSLASSSLASSSLATSCDEQTLSTSLKIARPRKSQSGKVLSNLPTPTSSGYSSSINSSMIDRGRSRSRVGVSQSQPSSRSSSPAPRLSYITQIQPDVVPQSMMGFGRRRSTTGLNKSREGSRDSSPNRSYGLGRERRSSGQAKTRGRNLAMQRSVPGEDFVSTRTKAGASSTCDSDDVNSETSSVCSDGSSYWNCGRQVTEDTSEIIACLSSGSWSDRRDGLLALQHLLNNNRTLSRSELKKVTDIFSRMFHDPHGKVFSVFMETLSQLVIVHHGDMHDWLYILMTRLLAKTGADLLGSTQAKIQRTLDTVRSSFPTNQQFMLLAKLLIDQTQSPNLKVKVAMLCYLHGLTQLMNPSDFINTSDVRLAISRIITWTTEPKSVDVRKAAQAALLSLHALNQPEFELIMSVLPKTFQEGAERILQNRSHHSGQSSEAHSLKDPSSPVSNNGGQGSGLVLKPIQPASSPAPPQAATSDEIYDSIRQTSEDIHALVRHGSAYKRSELPIKSVSLASSRGALPGSLTVESRIPSFLQNLPDVDIVAKMAAGRGRKDSCNGAIQSWFGMSNVIKKEREEAEKNASDSQVLLSVPAILQELSHHNERNEERKSCLLQLMKKSREESTVTWDEYFNTVLLILLETLADSDGSIRALSLRVLSEFLRCHPERFHEYVELTVVRSLEAHKDTVKEVTRAAEECSNLLSRIISPERSHVVLGPLIESEDFPINLAAIKMMTQIVEESEAATVLSILPQITPSLLKAYDNNQSSVRKSSVICLVAVYMIVGEELRPYLQDLHGSKVKLLNVYIKRALDQQAASSCGTSKTSSPTSVIEA